MEEYTIYLSEFQKTKNLNVFLIQNKNVKFE